MTSREPLVTVSLSWLCSPQFVKLWHTLIFFYVVKLDSLNIDPLGRYIYSHQHIKLSRTIIYCCRCIDAESAPLLVGREIAKSVEAVGFVTSRTPKGKHPVRFKSISYAVKFSHFVSYMQPKLTIKSSLPLPAHTHRPHSLRCFFAFQSLTCSQECLSCSIGTEWGWSHTDRKIDSRKVKRLTNSNPIVGFIFPIKSE